MAEALRTVPEPGWRAQRLLFPVSALLLVGALLVAPVAYWRGVNAISPYDSPPRALPVPNGHERARAALSKVDQGLLAPSPNWRELSPRILAERVTMLQPALDGVKAQFSVPWAVPAEPRLRQQSFADCATWYAIRSRLAREEGDPGRALEYAVDAVELGENACRNGWVVNRYEGQRCQEIGLEAAERTFPDLREEGLLAQIRRVRRIRLDWPPIAETLENERLTSLRACTEHLRAVERHSLWEQLAAAERSDAGFSSLTGSSSLIGRVDPPPHLYQWPVWQQVLTPHGTARAELDQYYRDLILASARPAPDGVPHTDPASLWVKRFANSSFTGRYRGEWPRNNLALLETALAVRLYYLKRHQYPPSVDAVPREWLPELPRDVWDQPVAYRLVKGKPLVYSWGPDLTDNGGQAANPVGVLHDKHGDLLFGRLCSEDWERVKPTRFTRR